MTEHLGLWISGIKSKFRFTGTSSYKKPVFIYGKLSLKDLYSLRIIQNNHELYKYLIIVFYFHLNIRIFLIIYFKIYQFDI